MIRISLLGAGRIGKMHAYNIKANLNADFRYIADVNENSAKKLAKEVKVKVTDFQTAITADDVDAVVIATPTSTHVKLSHLALNAGKAVFCEKPIDLDIKKTQEIVDHVEKSNLPYFVGFHRRFDPSFHSLHHKLAQLGTLEQLLIISRDAELPPIEFIKTSGGIFNDMSIHDFDMALWLTNEPVETIYATASCKVDPRVAEVGDVDTATLILTTKNTQCTILNSRRAVYGHDQRIEAFGEKGMIKVANLKPTALHQLGAKGENSDLLESSFLKRFQIAYQKEMNHFITQLMNNQPMLTTAKASLEATKLANAAYDSLKKGCPVSL